jgi:DNA-binding cell septation regulator SpoVG
MATVISVNSAWDIHARPIEPQGGLLGFASVTVGGIRIDDFKIVERKDGELFVGMPSKADPKSETGYRNTASIGKDFKADFNTAVIAAYHAARERSAKKPPPVKAQRAKAQKQANEHNAKLPAPEKGEKTQQAGR